MEPKPQKNQGTIPRLHQKYEGLFILQAAPATHGKEEEIAKKYLKFTLNQLSNYYYES